MEAEPDLEALRWAYAEAFVAEGEFAEDRLPVIFEQVQIRRTVAQDGSVTMEVDGGSLGGRFGLDDCSSVERVLEGVRIAAEVHAEHFVWDLSTETGIDEEWPTPQVTRANSIWPRVEGSNLRYSFPPDDDLDTD